MFTDRSHTDRHTFGFKLILPNIFLRTTTDRMNTLVTFIGSTHSKQETTSTHSNQHSTQLLESYNLF